MKKGSIQSMLEEMLSLGRYSGLSSFSDPKLWKELTCRERELLGSLFLMQGNKFASEGNVEAINCFRLAAKAAPSSPQVFYKIGEAFVGMGENPKILRKACRYFAKAVNLNPDYFEAWAAYAQTETRFGEMNKDIANFINADSKYQKAYDLLVGREANPGVLCWKWGGLWYRIAKLSGEPSDLHKAIQKFTLAKETALEDPSFLNDFGNILAEQAILIGSFELFEKAAREYEECIKKNPQHAPAYLNLGCASMRLFDSTGDLIYFQKGDEAFRASSEIDPHQSALWLFWGVLELTYAKRRLGSEDEVQERFQSAIKKFEVADLCEPDHPVVLIKWAESLMCLGSVEESCLHLKEALEKIKKSIQKDSDRGEAWYFYGRVLIELGRYFQDERILHEAKEKFHHGLKLDPQFTAFHYGIAEACMELSEYSEEIAHLEEAKRHFKKVVAANSSLPPQFWLDFGIAQLRIGEAHKDLLEVEASVACFERALAFYEGKKTSPLALDIIFHFASAKSIIGDLTDDPQIIEKAAHLFAQILHEDPQFESIRLQYALSLQHLGEMVSDVDILRESITQYEIAISIDPEDDLAWGGLGVSLISLSEMLDDPMHKAEVADLRRKAELNLLHAASLGCDQSYYSLACLFSLAEDVDESLYFLEKARSKNALPPVEDIMNDEWLDNIRDKEEFRNFVSAFLSEDCDDDYLR